MIQRFKSGPIRFTRGRKFYEVAHAYEGIGFIGLCDGRVAARGDTPADVVAFLLARDSAHQGGTFATS